eukprot:8676998-Lingulodinium_polyedra.AAC.1
MATHRLSDHLKKKTPGAQQHNTHKVHNVCAGRGGWLEDPQVANMENPNPEWWQTLRQCQGPHPKHATD